MATQQIHFRQLVERSGNPEIVTLWTTPERNREFMKAVKENRVLTIVQEPASARKDFGRIGFHRNAHASYLVFPKSLPSAPKSRVIGIRYDLVRQSMPRDPVSPAMRPPRKRPVRRRPATREFDVIIRRTATLETCVRVPTRNEAQARREALATIRRQPMDLSKAVFHDEIKSVE